MMPMTAAGIARCGDNHRALSLSSLLKGLMLVYFAVSLVVLIGVCGLAVDTARFELRTLQLQAAADAGALTGADEWGRKNSAWATAAATDAQAVATANGLGTVTVSSQLAASQGSYANDYASVQTVVSQTLPTVFLGILSSAATTKTVKATAVADPPPCMYFLGTPSSNHAGAAIDLSSAGMNLSCPIYVKTMPFVDGFSNIQNHQIKTSVAGSGGVPGGGYTTYPPFYNYPVLSDPLAYVTAPTYTGCDNMVQIKIILPGQTLHPGRYCGLLGLPGISVAGVPVTMAPGLYIVTGGVSFINTTVTGTGVTIYMTKGGLAGYGIFYEQNSAINLTAPTDSSLQGIPGVTLFTDRNWVGGNEDLQFQGGYWYGDGIIYSMATGLGIYACNFAAPNYMNMVVANEDSYLGTIYATANYATVSGGSPLHNAVTLVQ